MAKRTGSIFVLTDFSGLQRFVVFLTTSKRMRRFSFEAVLTREFLRNDSLVRLLTCNFNHPYSTYPGSHVLYPSEWLWRKKQLLEEEQVSFPQQG